jgi:hypothetical protein
MRGLHFTPSYCQLGHITKHISGILLGPHLVIRGHHTDGPGTLGTEEALGGNEGTSSEGLHICYDPTIADPAGEPAFISWDTPRAEIEFFLVGTKVEGDFANLDDFLGLTNHHFIQP